jgi:hypothetical protein
MTRPPHTRHDLSAILALNPMNSGSRDGSDSDQRANWGLTLKENQKQRNMRVLANEKSVRHRKFEERSLALHREIARRIRSNPDLLSSVRERLSKDIRSGRFSISLTEAMQEWLDLLDSSSVEQLPELLIDEGENGRRLRQSTPFAGILTKEERRRILEKHESAGV